MTENLPAYEQVQDALRRADAKATTLLSLVGAAFAGVVALSGREVPAVAAVFLWVVMAALLVSVAVLLSAVRPRLSKEPIPGTWLHAATVGPNSVLESATDAAASVSSATHLCTLARIARVKYQRINVAVGLVFLALPLLVSALLAMAVA